MRLTVIVLFMSLLATSAWAGTFRDDFSDGNLEGWMLTFGTLPIVPLESMAKVRNGVLTFRRTSGWGVHLTIGNADTWSDYTIECDMKITERIPNEWGGSFHYAGFIGRLRPENKLSIDILGFALNLKATPTIWKFVKFQKNQWLINTQTNFNAELAAWYHLKSVMKGNNFKFYVDNNLISSFNSGNISTGRVGINIGGCTAEFDNIVITGDDVPDVGPSGYAVKPKSKLTTTWGRLKK